MKNNIIICCVVFGPEIRNHLDLDSLGSPSTRSHRISPILLRCLNSSAGCKVRLRTHADLINRPLHEIRNSRAQIRRPRAESLVAFTSRKARSEQTLYASPSFHLEARQNSTRSPAAPQRCFCRQQSPHQSPPTQS